MKTYIHNAPEFCKKPQPFGALGIRRAEARQNRKYTRRCRKAISRSDSIECQHAKHVLFFTKLNYAEYIVAFFIFFLLCTAEFAFAIPTIIIDYKNNTLSVDIPQSNVDMDTCIKNGLELSCRYTFKPCTEKRAWFDSCKKEKTVVRSVKYVPIEGSYKVATDLFQDKEQPEVIQMDSFDLALKKILHLENISTSFIAKEGGGFFNNPRAYLDSRIICSCKEDYNQSIAGVAKILTFGIIELNPYDSGTIKYRQ